MRVSFANLDDHVYDDIGRAVRAIARGYGRAYEASKAEQVGAAQARDQEAATRKTARAKTARRKKE